tara:strand:+ start:1853 stop:3883 length:2031 start_codon:yes stop_codon:yes gene_type:complete
VGELAINTADAKLFTKHTDNSIKEISGTGGDVVDDTSPELGGDLQSNGNDIDLADNDKLIAGTGGDLEFYHDGSNSYIDHVGADAQTLFIRNTTATVNGTDGISIQTKGTQPHYINMRNNAGVDIGVYGSDKMTVSSLGIYSNTGYILNSPTYTVAWRNTSNNTYQYLKAATPSGDQTITLPNLTGTAVVEETGGVVLNNGVIDLKNGGTQSEVRLYCESSNAHYAGLKAPAHADFTGNVTSTLPSVTGTLIGTANADAPATTTSSSDADHVLINDGGVLKKITPSDLGIGSGGGGSASDSFKTIAVSGQSNVVADSSTDTLTYVAGSNMTITTDASTDTITFASSGSGGSYANSDVDTHLNLSSASANEVLSYNGSDYAWVAQSGGGGGGATNLTGLSDVTISSVQNNDLLKYNSTAGEWQNTNLGISVAPSISIDSSTYIGNRTATITPSSGTYDQPAYYAEVRDPTNTTTLVTNANITKSGNTLSWSQTTTGVNLILRVKTQDFGDLESDFATQTFTATSFPIRRYYRLTGTGATNMTYVRDISLYTSLGQSGNNYPATLSSNTTPSPYVASSSGHYGTYEPWKAFDSFATSSGWWNLATGPYSGWYIQIDLGSSSSIAIQSAKLNINPTYQGSGAGQTYTLAGSSTGSFTGEQVTIATHTGPVTGVGYLNLN